MIAIYTALFGDYDKVQPAKWDNSFLFTDQDIKVNGWNKIIIGNGIIDTLRIEDSKLLSRYWFNLGFKWFGSEYTIMHGANAQLKVNPEELIQYLGDNDIAVCKHPRKNVYDEAKAVIRMGKDKAEIVNSQMERYKSEGFDGNDLSALILVIRRNTPMLREFSLALWEEIKNNSHRDQLAFDYMRWKMNFPISRLPKHWNNYLNLRKHNHQGKK